MIKTYSTPLISAQINLAKLSWGLIHKVLPREARIGGLLTNLKGLSRNNIVREDLPLLTAESEDPIFLCRGFSLYEEDKEKEPDNSEYKEECYFAVNSHFYGFLNRKKIQYKTEITSEGRLNEYLLRPVFEFDPKIEIKELFFGLEYFKPHLFWMIGMAPKLSKAIIIQTDSKNLYVKINAEADSEENIDLIHLLKETFEIKL